MTRRYDASVEAAPALAVFEARGRDAGLSAGLATAGLTMPEAAGMMLRQPDGAEVLRLGPRRVLVLADGELEAQLGPALARGFSQVPDADVALVSDMVCVFDLGGVGAEDILAQGAPLDLSKRAFPEGTGTGTELWGATVILIRRAGRSPGFRIIVERSFAGFIEDWLAVASGEASTLRPGVMAAPPPSWKPS